MTPMVQDILALTLVAACTVAMAWQVVRAFRGAGTLGRCCSKGCGGAVEQMRKVDGAATSKVVFIPSSSLRRR